MQKGIFFSLGVILLISVTRVKLTKTSHEKYHEVVHPSASSAIDMDELWPFHQTLSQSDPSIDDLMNLVEERRVSAIRL